MEFNHQTVKKIRGLIVFTVIVVVAGVNYRRLLDVLAGLVHIAFPFILGAVIAFILNVPMRRIEKCFAGVKRGKKLHRPVSLLLTILAVLGILFLVVFVVAPELIRTLWGLRRSIPVFFAGVQTEAESLFREYPQLVEYVSSLQVDWDQVLRNIVSFLTTGAGSMLSTTMAAAVSIVNGVSTFLIGFIFSIYILLQKEILARQIRRLLEAYLPEQAVERIVYIAAKSEKTFSSFLTGQCVEAVILGTMFFVSLSLLGLPYELLIGVLIAFTALIPIFGAFIGLGVGAFLMIMVSPMDTLVFVILFFVLQQLEGNLIYPHVVGSSVGLPSIWVLVAVTIGGSMMGIVGMLIFIPLTSVIYALLRESVQARLAEKKRPEEI